MRFKAKKRYGDYKTDNCPFCGKVATLMNERGVAVCRLHLKEKFEDRKCVCGRWLELRSGKFGPYFNCLNCGNLSYDKGLERSTAVKSEPVTTETKTTSKPALKSSLYEKKEVQITTDDVEYFD